MALVAGSGGLAGAKRTIRICICMYVCMYVYIYIYTYIYVD